MHRIRRRFLITSFLLVCAILAFGLFQRFYGTPAVTTAKVTRGPAVEAVYASGTVEPVYWAKVQPLGTGRIASVEAFEGDAVTVNQVLADVETAKAVVEVSSPFAGVVAALHGAEGETLEVGAPLVTFTLEGAEPDVGARLGRYAELGRRTAERIRDARLVAFPELGHSPQVQAPEEFNAALLENLEQVSAVE